MLLQDTAGEHSVTYILLTKVNILMLTANWKVKQYHGLKTSSYGKNTSTVLTETDQLIQNIALGFK